YSRKISPLAGLMLAIRRLGISNTPCVLMTGFLLGYPWLDAATNAVLSDLNRPFSTPSTDGLNCNQISAANDHGVVEVVHGRADVAWNQKKKLADRRDCGAGGRAHGQVFFTGGERLEFRTAKDGAGRDAGIGRDALMSTVTGDHGRCRMAYDTRHNHHGGEIPIVRRQLSQGRRIAVNDRSRRHPVQERRAFESPERQTALERP